MMQLSKRLQAVADMVTNTSCVADVGTDHGYIPIYLVEHGICGKAIAMDIKKGPLQRAQKHIEEHKLGAYIQTRLSDGLTALKKGEAGTIVIAGMGGATMSAILEAGKAVIEPDTVLVLQPQSELPEFRQYLKTHEFELLSEDMVQEDGKYYPMMKVCRKGAGSRKEEGQQPCSRLELLYGPLLLKQKHPVLQEFLHWQLGQKEKIQKNLLQKAAPEIRARRMEQVGDEIACIREALKLYGEEE